MPDVQKSATLNFIADLCKLTSNLNKCSCDQYCVNLKIPVLLRQENQMQG